MRDSQKTPPAATSAPATITGRVPVRASSCDVTPAATIDAEHTGR